MACAMCNPGRTGKQGLSEGLERHAATTIPSGLPDLWRFRGGHNFSGRARERGGDAGWTGVCALSPAARVREC